MNKFRLPTKVFNPPDSAVNFEDYFSLRYDDSRRRPNDRVYLPICWTNYYISKNYCKDDMSELQSELDALPRNYSYFTVYQWDDPICQDLKDLDIFVYGQGGYGDYPIPLNCIPHGSFRNDGKFSIRPTLASFIGSVDGRHPIREKMKDVFAKEKDCLVEDRRGKGFFTKFMKLMSESKFALCPRGYGKTSFRICEALEAGAIPVYIFDDPWIPFVDVLAFEGYGVLCHEDKLEELPSYLREIAANEQLMKNLRNNGKIAYEKFYSYDGCMNQILRMESKYNADLREE